MLTSGVVTPGSPPFLWQHWNRCDNTGSQVKELIHLKTNLACWFALLVLAGTISTWTVVLSPGSPQPQECVCWHMQGRLAARTVGEGGVSSVRSLWLAEAETMTYVNKIFPVFMKINEAKPFFSVRETFSWPESPMRSGILIIAQFRSWESRY